MGAETQRHIHRMFKGHRALCGQLDQTEIALLLASPQTECRSVAAAQIRGQGNIGALVVASEDPGYYRSSKKEEKGKKKSKRAIKEEKNSKKEKATKGNNKKRE